jgi:hypothetical protein
MHGVARNFFTLAVLYALCGMGLGLHMSITQDHSQMPVHAHAMVAGWLMSAVFAFFYHLVPTAARSRLAPLHFWSTAISGIALIVGLYFLLAGHEAVEPVVAIGSMVFYASLILFAGIAFTALWKSEGRELYPNGTAAGSSLKNRPVR